VFLLSIAIALLPVLVFLLALLAMDSFKLLPPRTLTFAIGSGVLAAVLCLMLHRQAVEAGIPPAVLKRLVAPLTEETAKAALVVSLLMRRRLGFAVDAAIAGFAVGAGFAVAENVDYLRVAAGARIWLWIVRGFGTAILHGATTAVFAMIARVAWERQGNRRFRGLLGAWAAAVGIHAAFNSLILPPIAFTLLLLIGLPILIVYVFRRSEAATREWVTAGLDLDLDLLELISTDAFSHTRFGRHLRDLTTTVSGPIVADMFCLLRLELELAIQAKGLLIAKQAGLQLPPDEDLRAGLRELAYLERSIGRTGTLALKGFHVTSDRDKWHRWLLAQSR
jgi:RsiW-degrading membrane proteinase PrsW (M82 family)